MTLLSGMSCRPIHMAEFSDTSGTTGAIEAAAAGQHPSVDSDPTVDGLSVGRDRTTTAGSLSTQYIKQRELIVCLATVQTIEVI